MRIPANDNDTPADRVRGNFYDLRRRLTDGLQERLDALGATRAVRDGVAEYIGGLGEDLDRIEADTLRLTTEPKGLEPDLD